MVAARQVLPRDVYFWLKAVLLALVAVQGARLVWTIVTPLGPVGQWLPAAPATIPEAAQLALFSTFDPFRAGAGQATIPGPPAAPVSDLTLFGTRMSMGGAPGSAIIAGADGVQSSFTVGDEVAPGQRLLTVGFDFVLLTASGGAEQKLMMEGAEVEPPTSTTIGSASAAGTSLTPQTLRENVALAPRMAGGKVTGFLVSAIGDPAFLARTGLRDGDVITAVNGRPLTNPAALQSQIAPGARLSLSVERGAAMIPVALLIEGPQ